MTEDLQKDTPKRSRFSELSVLFPLLSLYTIAYMALTTANFFFGNAMPVQDGIMQIYIALLGAYAADKEVRRWIDRPEPPRQGSLFVYLWLLLYLVLFTLQTVQQAHIVPEYLRLVSLQVLAIFFGSKASKHLHSRRSSQSELDLSRQEKVLNLIKTKGSLTSAMVEQELNLSSASVRRLFREMGQAGLIARHGQYKHTRYTLPGSQPPA